jgi:branched-chain amino acid transport system permease protein
MLFEQIISGLALGCVYGLVALGFSLIYAAFRLPHFAQGDVLMLGAVFGLIATRAIGAYFIPVLLITIVLVAAAGIALERLVYRKIIHHAMAPKIICTVTIGILLQNLVLVGWGGKPEAFPTQGFSTLSLAVGGRAFPPVYLFIFVATIVLVVLLWLILLRTKLGLGMRATAYSHELSGLMGVNTNTTLIATFGLGAGLAGAAGLLIGQLILVSFTMGIVIGLKGFVAAVIGGFGNMPGALLGGLLLGVIENLGGGFISSGYKDLIAFGIMILVLIVRPAGIFGRRTETKV